jgi:Mn2+/Fe2+ NRAMP family transporter
MMLPFVFYYLLKLTNNRDIMGDFVNKPFQKKLGVASVAIISTASLLALVLSLFH